MKFRIHNVARYVRRFGRVQLSDEDIHQITYDVFGFVDNKMQDLFKQSINSYDTDFRAAPIDDPFEKKLLNTKMYRPFMSNYSSVQGLTMGYGCDSDSIMPMLFIDWMKRRRGILMHEQKSLTFTLLAKKRINEPFQMYTEEHIFPDCKWFFIGR